MNRSKQASKGGVHFNFWSTHLTQETLLHKHRVTRVMSDQLVPPGHPLQYNRRLSVIPFQEDIHDSRGLSPQLTVSDLVALTNLLRETINPVDQSPEALSEVSLTSQIRMNIAGGLVMLQLSLGYRDGSIDSYNYSCAL